MTDTANLAAAEQNPFIDYFKARWSGASVDDAMAKVMAQLDPALIEQQPLVQYFKHRIEGGDVAGAMLAARAAKADQSAEIYDERHPWLSDVEKFPDLLEPSIKSFQAQNAALQARSEALQAEIDELQTEVEALERTCEEYS